MQSTERRKNLTDNEIAGIVNYWYDQHVGHPYDRERKKSSFYDALNKSSDIKEMASDSLLLDILVRANNYTELPQYKLPLYRLCVQFMLNAWNIESLLDGTRNTGRSLDSQDKEEILQAIAASMKPTFDQRIITECGLKEIIEHKFMWFSFWNSWLVAERVIDDLKFSHTQNHLLQYTGEGFYAFVDHRFFDYFLATHFVDLFERKQTINIEYLKKELFGRYWCDTAWHGTLVLIAADIFDKFALELVEYLVLQLGEDRNFMNVFLAAECFLQIETHRFREATTAAIVLNDRLKALSNPKQNPDFIWKRASMLCHELGW
jgi:predicted NACHT family NTPase